MVHHLPESYETRLQVNKPDGRRAVKYIPAWLKRRIEMLGVRIKKTKGSLLVIDTPLERIKDLLPALQNTCRGQFSLVIRMSEELRQELQ